MYELSPDQITLIKNMIPYCVKKCDGLTSKVGDRAIFIHILKGCLKESLKGIINDDTAIGIVPVRINEMLISAYGNNFALIILKNDGKGNAYIDVNDEETIHWLI